MCSLYSSAYTRNTFHVTARKATLAEEASIWTLEGFLVCSVARRKTGSAIVAKFMHDVCVRERQTLVIYQRELDGDRVVKCTRLLSPVGNS
jgi:hypothetical protein